MKFICEIVCLVLICLISTSKGSCWRYGHACWGGHGKRTDHTFNLKTGLVQSSSAAAAKPTKLPPPTSVIFPQIRYGYDYPTPADYDVNYYGSSESIGGGNRNGYDDRYNYVVEDFSKGDSGGGGGGTEKWNSGININKARMNAINHQSRKYQEKPEQINTKFNNGGEGQKRDLMSYLFDRTQSKPEEENGEGEERRAKIPTRLQEYNKAFIRQFGGSNGISRNNNNSNRIKNISNEISKEQVEEHQSNNNNNNNSKSTEEEEEIRNVAHDLLNNLSQKDNQQQQQQQKHRMSYNQALKLLMLKSGK